MIYYVLFLITTTLASQSYFAQLTKLNHMVEQLKPDYISLYNYLNEHFQQFDPTELGLFTCITAKLHLYALYPNSTDLPESVPDLPRAYLYAKAAADYMPSSSDCSYILGMLNAFKLTPSYVISEALSNQTVVTSVEATKFSKLGYITYANMYLYFASLDKNRRARMALGFMNRYGINSKKNCSVAGTNYLQLAKDVFIDQYHLYGFYRDKSSFEKELYLKQIIDTESLVEDEIYMIEESRHMGLEQYLSSLQIADNYFYGRNGFRRDYAKAVEMYEKLKDVNNQEASTMLGMCYFKGLGVQKNLQTAYKLFSEAKKSDLASFMMALMEYHGLFIKQNKPSAVQKFISTKVYFNCFQLLLLNVEISKTSAQAKAFLGALAFQGKLQNYNIEQGVVWLQESAARGCIHARYLLGRAYLEGTKLNYNCERGVKHLSDTLFVVDTHSVTRPTQTVKLKIQERLQDMIELSKIAINKHHFAYAFFKYLELALSGDVIGMINSVYLIDILHSHFARNGSVWNNYHHITQDALYMHLSKNDLYPELKKVDQLLFGELTQLIPVQTLKRTLLNAKSSHGGDWSLYDHFAYIRFKMLFICEDQGESLCKFLNYKDDPKQVNNTKVLQAIAADSKKLHSSEAHYLLGRILQHKNKSEDAKAYYKVATGSWFVADLIWLWEGGDLTLKILDDLFFWASVCVIAIAGAVIHRNRMLIKLEQKQQQEANLRQPNTQQGQQQSSGQGAGLRQPEQIQSAARQRQLQVNQDKPMQEDEYQPKEKYM